MIILHQQDAVPTQQALPYASTCVMPAAFGIHKTSVDKSHQLSGCSQAVLHASPLTKLSVRKGTTCKLQSATEMLPRS